jgi:uncharacterized protein YjiS (DUF1127 family)
MEFMMRQSNATAPFGLLFLATTALISPTHEAITRKPLYGSLPPLQIRSSALSAMRKVLAGIDAWRRRAEERKNLALLSDHMLDDIGLNRFDVAHELEKPFWQP